MLTAACSKDATTDVNPSFKTIIGVDIENPDSRTYIGQPNVDGTYPVLWSEGDKVAVNGVAVTVDAKYVGTSSLKLEVDAAEEYKIAYPAENIKDDVLTVSEVQKFVEGSFAVGSGVLVGYSQTDDIKLKNLYGYLKFSVANAANVNRVTVVANGGEAISGTFNIDYKGAAISALAGKDIIRVTDVVATDGVATVVVAVPAGEYTKGFTVKVQDSSNGAMTKSLKGAGATVEAGVIYTMPQLSFAKTTTETLIMNANDLVDFIALANGDSGYDKWVNSDGEVKLGADIDLTGVNLKQIKTFAGKFNGQGFALKNLHLTLPLFKEILAEGVLKNLVIDQSCSLTPDLTSSNVSVGVIVGVGRGLVEGCVNNADVTINGNVTEDSIRFGLIVASGYGRIRDCINNGDFICNFPVVDQHIYVGGITGYYNPVAGQGQGEVFIQDCINNGVIKVTVGDVPRRAQIGGIIGATALSDQKDGSGNAVAVEEEGTIARCYNNGDVSYIYESLGSATYSNVGGIVGNAQAVITECENSGKVSYIIPVSDEASASRPAVGGIVASTLHSVTKCVNHGEVYVEGTWSSASSSSAGAASVGGQVQPNFGGIVGCAGHYSLSTDYKIENCTNYGKMTLKPSITTTATTKHFFGGIVGWTSIDLYNCVNHGEVYTESNALYAYFGGVVGYAKDGSLTQNCTNYGPFNLKHDVSGCTLSDVYSGTEKVRTFSGGVIGYACDIVSNCHNYGAGQCTVNTMNAYCGGAIGYANTGAPISNISNRGAFTYNINDIANVLSDYTGSTYHYIGGVIGKGDANIDTVVNYEQGALTVNTNVAGDFGGVVGYALANNYKLENQATMTLDFTYLGQTCDKACFIGGVIAKNYSEVTENLVSVDGCINSGKLTIKNLSYSSYIYTGGIVGSVAKGVGTFKDCVSEGGIEVDAPSIFRLGGVAGYTAACDVTNSSFTGKITTKRILAKSAVGGLIGHTAQGIRGGSVNCTIDAQGKSGIYVGGVMGTSSPDTWTGITVKSVVTASTGAYCGALLGGASSTITIVLGSAAAPVNISKSSTVQGVAIRGVDSDPLTGRPENVTFRKDKVVYIN